MKHTIIVIGEELQLNKPFLDYVFNMYERHFGEIGIIYYIHDSDKELPFYIENYSKNFNNITMIANDSNFYTISKILATLTTDTIELKNETLIPSRAKLYTKDSFLLHLNKAELNLIKAVPTKELPEFLINPRVDSKFFNILDIDIESAKILLEPLSSTYNVTFNLTELIPGLTHIKVQANKYGQIDGFLESASNLFPNKILNAKNIVEFVVKKLIKNNLKITFAESCTAGLCAARFGSIPGASSVFDGSVVTYANHIKKMWLDIDEKILENYGAVSAQCVEQMSLGALKLCNADYALSISGIAGPDGGTKEKPVGTVFISVANKNNKFQTEKLLLQGDRDYIREQSVLHAYALLLRANPEIFT